MFKPYDHQALDWTAEDGTRECRLCPTPITGWGHTLRHVGEAVRPANLNPADRAVVAAAAEQGARALEEMWTDRVTDYDRAWVIAEALLQAGMLDVRRRTRVAA